MTLQDDEELDTDQSQQLSCLTAALTGSLEGALSGLVAGTVYGIFAEKKFILQNVLKEHHKRDPPLALFSIMVRGATAAAVVAVFVGVLQGVSCSCVKSGATSGANPISAGIAGSCAGALRNVMHHETLRPPLLAQKSLAAGTFSAAVLGVGQMLFQDAKS